MKKCEICLKEKSFNLFKDHQRQTFDKLNGSSLKMNPTKYQFKYQPGRKNTRGTI